MKKVFAIALAVMMLLNVVLGCTGEKKKMDTFHVGCFFGGWGDKTVGKVRRVGG